MIPLLLDGARVPKVNQLPEDLKELAMRNGLDVRHASFHSDLDKLVRNLKARLGKADANRAEVGRAEGATPLINSHRWKNRAEHNRNNSLNHQSNRGCFRPLARLRPRYGGL